MSNFYDTATPYGASYVILRDGDKVAFVLRENTSWMNGYYGLPSGKVEKRESFSAAAIREAQEEVGVKIAPADLRYALTQHRQGTDEWVDVYFEVEKYEGEPYNAEPQVHSELTWLDINNLPDNVIPNVCQALEAVMAGKQYVEYGWEN